MIGNKDPAIQTQALQCISKIMVANWEFMKWSNCFPHSDSETDRQTDAASEVEQNNCRNEVSYFNGPTVLRGPVTG